MRTLVRRDDPVVWADVNSLGLETKESELLKSKIRIQVLGGEDQMQSQSLEHLKN
jgi:hypothetical protein